MGLELTLVLMKRFGVVIAVLAAANSMAFAQDKVELSLDPEVARLELPWTKACSAPVKDPETVSIVQLLSTPEKYEGKAITTIGYYRLGFEHSAIYLAQSDYEHDIWPNGLWVDSEMEIPTQNGYVIISGIFTSKLTGHFDGWPGGICGVSEAHEWPGHEH